MERIDNREIERCLLIKELVEFSLNAREGLGLGVDNASFMSIDERSFNVSIRYAISAAQMCLENKSEEAFNMLCTASKKYELVNRSLGDMYYYGIGVEKNLEEARKCYKTSLSCQEKAVGVADILGDYYYKLACAFNYGIGTDEDGSIAQSNLEEAYKYGSLRATFELITQYYGKGATVDDPMRALQLCREAIKQTEIKQIFDVDAAGLIYVAFGYMIFDPRFELDDESAFETFKKAANLGNATALYVLGAMHECGYETDQNLHAAVKCYAKAKKKGNKRAGEAKCAVKDIIYSKGIR